MDFKKLASCLLGAVLLLAVWFYWWSQPERQVRRAGARLFSALESRDFDSMGRLISESYGDRWQHDKSFVLRECREVFRQFLTLSIDRDDRGVEMGDGCWLLREKVTIQGIGGPLAMFARDEVNALREPFVMTWRKRGWKPWDWELTAVAQPELVLPR